MSGAVFRMPLTVSAGRLERSLERLAALAEAGDDAAFDEGIKQWFADLRAHVDLVMEATGLTSGELFELVAR